MTCPECRHHQSRIVATVKLEHITWRTHRCLSCHYEWHTSEIEDEPFETIHQMKREQYQA